jgi:hypothetical protein
MPITDFEVSVGSHSRDKHLRTYFDCLETASFLKPNPNFRDKDPHGIQEGGHSKKKSFLEEPCHSQMIACGGNVLAAFSQKILKLVRAINSLLTHITLPKHNQRYHTCYLWLRISRLFIQPEGIYES